MGGYMNNRLRGETIIVTDIKIEDNTTAGKYLIIDSDSDGTILTGDRTLTIDVNNADRVLDLGGDLTVEATSIINQDLSTDAAATFNTLNLAATSNQIVLQSAGVTGTLTATPASSNKTWTLQNVTGTIYQTGGTDVAVADGGTGVGVSTGTVAVVLSNSPTLVTPVLGAATGTSLSLTGGITVNSGSASGETGVNFYSIVDGGASATFSTIAQSDAEGIANVSDLRIGLDESSRTLIVCDRGDIATDFGLSAASHPTLVLVSADGSEIGKQRVDDSGNFTISGTNSDNSTFIVDNFESFEFKMGRDNSAGSVFTFNSNTNQELIASATQQAWVHFEGKVLQTSTAAVDLIYGNLDTANLTYGDGSTGDGNNLLRLAIGGTSKFRTDIYGYTKQGTSSGSLNDNATYDTTIPDSYTGIVIVENVTDTTSGVYHLDGTALVAINQNAAFTVTQGTDNKINVYINANVIRVENTNAGAKTVKVMFVGT